MAVVAVEVDFVVAVTVALEAIAIEVEEVYICFKYFLFNLIII